MTATYHVRTSVFEGPLDLLLHLVEKRKLLINDISLASVADDYMAHVRTFEALPLRDTTHFVLVASTLVWLKSRSILPGLTTEEEEASVDELQDRLRKYQIVQTMATHVRERAGSTPIYFREHVATRLTPIFTPDPATNVDTVHTHALAIIRSLPVTEREMEARVSRVVSIEEVIDRITEHVTRHLRSCFSRFIREADYTDQSVIVGFLAILELHKQGALHLSQEDLFDDIRMESIPGASLPVGATS